MYVIEVVPVFFSVIAYKFYFYIIEAILFLQIFLSPALRECIIGISRCKFRKLLVERFTNGDEKVTDGR